MSFFRRLKLPPVASFGRMDWKRAAIELEDEVRRLRDVLSAWPEDALPIVVGDSIDGGATITDSPTITATTEEDTVTFDVNNDSITDAKLSPMAANTVKGNATAATANPADISVGTNTVLGRVAGNIVAAQLATGQVADDAITYAKIQNVSASPRFLARVTAGAGNVEEATPAQAIAALTLTARPAQFSANQNDLAITFGTNYFSTDAARDFTGFVASTVDGQEAKIINNGAQNVVLKHLNAGSAAGNQIITPGGTDLTLTPALACLLIYDLTATKWRAFAL